MLKVLLLLVIKLFCKININPPSDSKTTITITINIISETKLSLISIDEIKCFHNNISLVCIPLHHYFKQYKSV